MISNGEYSPITLMGGGGERMPYNFLYELLQGSSSTGIGYFNDFTIYSWLGQNDAISGLKLHTISVENDGFTLSSAISVFPLEHKTTFMRRQMT